MKQTDNMIKKRVLREKSDLVTVKNLNVNFGVSNSQNFDENFFCGVMLVNYKKLFNDVNQMSLVNELKITRVSKTLN